MYSPFRFLMSSTGGVVMAFGLGLSMMAMIRVEFTPSEKHKAAQWLINPIVEDIQITSREITPPELKTVEVPPPPPEMGFLDTNAPSEPPAQTVEIIIDIPDPMLDGVEVNIVPDEQQEQPIVRIPPIMPPRAEKSGRCEVIFDLNANGAPMNVRTGFCSASYFKRPSIRSVQGWKYRPRRVGGEAVVKTGMREVIVFDLRDENGRPIPE